MTTTTTIHSAVKPLSVMRSLLQHASVKVTMLMVGQALLLLLQATAATRLMFSWEITRCACHSLCNQFAWLVSFINNVLCLY